MTSLTRNEKKDNLFWEKHLTQWHVSGLNQAQYCRKHTLKEHDFSYQKCKRLNKTSIETNVTPSFIQVQLQPKHIEPPSLTLHH